MKNKSKVAYLPYFGNINFNLVDVKTLVKHKTKTRILINNLFDNESKKLQVINYNFCSDSYLLTINKSYLSHDYFTDIITFDLSESDEVIGDVYISIDTVKENAKTNRVPFHNELQRVIIHGALHLCGYKDKTSSEIKQMRSKEDYYLSLL